MKIKSFNENNNSTVNSKSFYLLTKHGEDNDYNYLIDSYENVCNYILYEIYTYLEDNDNDELDNFDNLRIDADLDSMIEYYDNLVDEDVDLSRISFESIEFEDDVIFKDWMNERINSKKYNL